MKWDILDFFLSGRKYVRKSIILGVKWDLISIFVCTYVDSIAYIFVRCYDVILETCRWEYLV